MSPSASREAESGQGAGEGGAEVVPAGEVPDPAALDGDWATGEGDTRRALLFMGGYVIYTYTLPGGVEGTCDGSVTEEGAMRVGNCSTQDAEEEMDTEATLLLDGDVLYLTWASGTTEAYEPTTAFGEERTTEPEPTDGMAEFDYDQWMQDMEELEDIFESYGH
ncbi:hypothetical protein E1265_06125 [Streptomyces sp. 8K308]|uniref:hypothetical protein n=1 Tax=Streptomyces sp. 8K308 TaxID=2530388 RepID=UPI00104C1367|nr:hypothetical protein [Streptomyces sp. 8K308]TDC25835.1 hypothetical protein E1265_06125 [Streptomyces sp. 8K308]